MRTQLLRITKRILNRSYVIGITSTIELKRNMEANDLITVLQEVFPYKTLTVKNSKVYFEYNQPYRHFNVTMEPVCEEVYKQDESTSRAYAYRLITDINCESRYRDIRNCIDDLLNALYNIERDIIREVDAYPSKRLLYAQGKHLRNFLKITKDLKTDQITGTTELGVRFIYSRDKLIIDSDLDSKAIRWFIDAVTEIA